MAAYGLILPKVIIEAFKKAREKTPTAELVIVGDGVEKDALLKQAEELGLLKMDFLGLRTLTVINDCVKMVKKKNPHFDIECKKNSAENSYIISIILPDDATGTITIEIDGKPYWFFARRYGQEDALWHTSKNISWNELNYSLEMYITKDEVTQGYFKRFQIIEFGGQPWEVQDINIYATDGFMVVLLKEYFNNTIEKQVEEENHNNEPLPENNNIATKIEGNLIVYPYDEVEYTISGATGGYWEINGTKAKILNQTSSSSSSSDNIYILSAKHYVVDIDEEISPYDETLNDMSADEKREWVDNVLKKIDEKGINRNEKTIFLAGHSYLDYLIEYFSDYEIPYQDEGLSGIGYIL